MNNSKEEKIRWSIKKFQDTEQSLERKKNSSLFEQINKKMK